LKIASAIGLRQTFAVQTKSTLISSSSLRAIDAANPHPGFGGGSLDRAAVDVL
jgi:hypothetical protein